MFYSMFYMMKLPTEIVILDFRLMNVVFPDFNLLLLTYVTRTTYLVGSLSFLFFF